MFAGMRALVAGDEVETFLGDLAHRLNVFVQFEVQHRAHMQAAHRGMGVPGALGAVPVENLGQPSGIGGEVRQFDGAILDKGHRLTVVLHRHHDIEPRTAQLGNPALQGGVGHLGHPAPVPARSAPGEPQIPHHLFKLF